MGTPGSELGDLPAVDEFPETTFRVVVVGPPIVFPVLPVMKMPGPLPAGAVPAALVYDWILLLVAFALLVGAGVVRTPTLVAWAAALGAVLSIGVFLIDLQVEEWGRAISIAPLTLLVAFFLLVARIGKWSAARRVPADSP